MRLNHIDLQVSDVPHAVDFFERHFGLHQTSNRASPAIAILEDGGGFVLVLQRQPPEAIAYPEGFHVGFLVDDPAAVHAFQASAKAAGLTVSDVIVNGRGTLSYCTYRDGFVVEVSCYRQRA